MTKRQHTPVVPFHLLVVISLTVTLFTLTLLQAIPGGPLSSGLVQLTTTSPSVSPTTSPSLSPTSAFCLPALVTCCFSVIHLVVDIYIGDVRMTDFIYPSGFNGDRTVVKFIQFYEPAQDRSVIAIKGYQNAFPNHGALALSCHSQKPDSPWNLVRSRQPGGGWREVRSSSASFDQTPANWWSSNYTGVTYPPINYTTTYSFFPNITAYPDVCGPYNASHRTRPNTNNKYWTLVRNVTQPQSVCWPPPVITNRPTRSPTVSPTTSIPTLSPTTPVPTRSPICKPPLPDIVLMVDGSSSMEDGVPGLVGYANKREAVTAALLAFIQYAQLPDARYALVRFAGEFFRLGVTTFQSYYEVEDFTSNITRITETIQNIGVGGGTTNTSGALDYVRTVTLRSEMNRPGSTRYVMLLTDGYPSDIDGHSTPEATTLAETAAAALVTAHPDVKFIFFKMGNDYPAGFFNASADLVYSTTFNELPLTITDVPLCSL